MTGRSRTCNQTTTMDQLTAELKDVVEGKIDFEGQKLAEQMQKIVGVVATVIAFLIGFVTQSLFLCMSVFGGIIAILLVVVVPPWPIFKQHPVKWLNSK